MAEKTGLSRVVAESLAVQDAVVDAMSDIDLFGEDAAPAPRKRGRPPGAIGQKTKDQAAFVLGQGRHPLSVLAEMVNDARRGDETRIKASAVLLPYICQKQPIAVEATDRRIMTLQVAVTPGVAKRIVDGSATGWKEEIILDGESVENQCVEDFQNRMLNAPELNGKTQADEKKTQKRGGAADKISAGQPASGGRA